MAMAMAMAGKQKNEFWRELRHKGGCCSFGWAMYAPWAFYMLYGQMGIIQPQTANMAAYWPP
jgi:hypothetical protein